jgi:hypothetical protein
MNALYRSFAGLEALAYRGADPSEDERDADQKEEDPILNVKYVSGFVSREQGEGNGDPKRLAHALPPSWEKA